MFDKFLYTLLKATVRCLVAIFFPLRVEGRENLPGKGPFIIAANHASFLDPIVMQMAVPPNIRWITKQAVYRKKYLKLIHRLCRSIPVNGAVDKALTAIKEGSVIGIFPEGTRSPDGKIRKADVGVAILALKSGSIVIPIGIKGSFEAFPQRRRLPRPHRITVRIGRPFSFERDGRTEFPGTLLTEKRDYIVERIKELL